MHLTMINGAFVPQLALLGEELKVPVYRFLRELLIRKYGADFYEKIQIAADLIEKTTRIILHHEFYCRLKFSLSIVAFLSG